MPGKFSVDPLPRVWSLEPLQVALNQQVLLPTVLLPTLSATKSKALAAAGWPPLKTAGCFIREKVLLTRSHPLRLKATEADEELVAAAGSAVRIQEVPPRTPSLARRAVKRATPPLNVIQRNNKILPVNIVVSATMTRTCVSPTTRSWQPNIGLFKPKDHQPLPQVSRADLAPDPIWSPSHILPYQTRWQSFATVNSADRASWP